MGKKDGELWDDSALIDAFEEAVSSYKMMHGMKQIDGLKEESKALDGAQVEIASDDSKSHVEQSLEVMHASNSVVEATSLAEKEEISEDVLNAMPEQQAILTDSKGQPVADYNLLVNQYYELQEKLQVTWEQLQQFGYLSDQFPQTTAEAGFSDTAANVEASGLSSDAMHTDITPALANQYNSFVGTKPEMYQQQHLPCGCLNNQYSYSAGVQGHEQATIDSGSLPTVICCCCPCTNKSVVCSPCPAGVCNLCTNAVPGSFAEKSLPPDDSGIIKVAMEAVEKVISTIKNQTSDQQEECGKTSTGNKVTSSKDDGCETDISTVINAWFSAGLATGKYLAEQSNARRNKD